MQLELELPSHESTGPIDPVALAGEVDGKQVKLPIDAVVLAARAGTLTQDWTLYPNDPDVGANVTIRGHSVEMAAAEKLACIPRKEMKDIFDIRRLLQHYELDREKVYELAVRRVRFNLLHGIRARELDNLSTYFRKRRKDFRRRLRNSPETIYPPLDAAETDAMLEFVADWLDGIGEG